MNISLRAVLVTLYVLLTCGVLFVAIGILKRLRKTGAAPNGDPRRTDFFDRAADDQLGQVLFILCVFVANWNPPARQFTVWFGVFYWLGMALWLYHKVRYADFIAGDLVPGPPIFYRRFARWCYARFVREDKKRVG